MSLGVRPDIGDLAAAGGASRSSELSGTYSDQLDGQGCVVIRSTTDRQMARKPTFHEKDLAVEGAPSAEDIQDQLLREGIAMSCRKGMKPESPNQDSFCIVMGESEEGGAPGFRLYCVFDGHGPLGHDISEFAVETLPKLFLRDPRRLSDNPTAALHDAFVQCQQLLERKGSMSNESGTTCTVAYLPEPDNVWMAHVADSRAVIAVAAAGGRVKGKDLTVDHKPELEGEKRRIESKGGRVVFDGYFNYRVYSREGRGGLNMSRALGDTLTHAAGVTEEPEVSNRRLEISKGVDEAGRDLFIMLCSDGVWEFIPSQEAAEIVKKHGRDGVKAAVEELTQKSYDRWMDDSDGEVSDDITAVIVWL